MKKTFLGQITTACVMIVASNSTSDAQSGPPAFTISPAKMPRVSTVDDRFQSFNVEMVEITGGRFWKPYRDVENVLNQQASAKKEGASGAQPVGIDPRLFQQRPAIDLTNPRLRKLAAALGPAYMRVSGTWANSTYFPDSDQPAPKDPPSGFGGVLTREQWKNVVEFAHQADAMLVTSFAISSGTRDAAGLWTPNQARQILDYTKSLGGDIVAAEFMNEPTFAVIGAAPKGYDASAYGRDLAVFLPFMRQISPATIILGPGGVGEGIPLASGAMARSLLKSEDLLKVTGPVFDAFSYHSYATISKRCTSLGGAPQMQPEQALSEDFLSRADRIEQYYANLRDQFLPGKPIWLTETADAACGGNPWASTFLDSFRYLDQLGSLAKLGVRVQMHNTLASSDYGLLDEKTFEPRPNYWAALVWRKLMGSTVLDPGSSKEPGLHLYAHCLRGHPGGVAVLAINTNRQASRAAGLSATAEQYTFTAKSLEDPVVQLNGTELKLGAGDALPKLAGAPISSGKITFAADSITFLAVPNAGNSSCR